MQYSKFQILNSKFLLLISLIFISLNLSPSARAGETFFDAPTQEIPIGEQFETDFFLNTQGEDINAIEGKIIFPSELLELKEIRDANSIISLWIERPVIVRKTDTNITFAGITPGSYTGEKGLIFSMIFQAKKEGQGIIDITESRALRNDGLGTETSLAISNFPFSVAKKISVGPSPITIIKDSDSPEKFTPIISHDPSLFDNKYFLVFTTQDKGSGVDHYEVLEKREFRILNLKFRKDKWTKAESPYVLRDQELKSHIYVKAIDKRGNERIAMLIPQNPLAWYENYLIWDIIGVVIVVGIVIGMVVRYLIEGRRRKNLESKI